MKPPVIHVVTPESSSGKLWEEVQRLLAVEAESARTIAHLNQTHREVSEMQQARIAKLEEALDTIADHRTQLPWSECRRIARTALGPANLQETDLQQSLEEVRQLKEEIAMMQEGAEVCAADCEDEKQYGPTIRRILARLQSLLAAKSAGMKPEAL